VNVWLTPVLLVTSVHCAIAAPKYPEKPTCVDPEVREEIREIMLAGLKEALRRQTSRVFTNWMKDPFEQPGRARAGLKRSVEAYIGAQREAKNWNPPLCKG